MTEFTSETDVETILDDLDAAYARAADALRTALQRFIDTGEAPSDDANAFHYPELRIEYHGGRNGPVMPRAFARLSRPGLYATSITRPALFRAYLREQLTLLVRDYPAIVTVGLSDQPIPYPYVLDGSIEPGAADFQVSDLARWFPIVQLRHIGDEIADGDWRAGLDQSLPLALFEAPRIDFSLARIRHYTGTPAEHVQPYILFTNYVRYVDEFVAWAIAELHREGSPYRALSVAGQVVVTRDTANAAALVEGASWRKVQMPAYHLMREDGQGVSLFNIGVGPANAKNICDHLAVLRPQAWMMIGHCGGLRPSQSIGDYVLAHAYQRDDHIMDDVLPVSTPIPPIAEVQQALFRAAEEVSGDSGDALKRRLRTGTVVTTDDRNWELRFTLSARRFNQSRAVAIDMESATIAAQGYRFRVPYGTLLCVSDKPLHGEIKLPGQANHFYERSVSQHLRIGLRTVDLLREQGDALHSRKLRSFDEPPLR